MSERNVVPFRKVRRCVVLSRNVATSRCGAEYSWCLHVLRKQPWKRRDVKSKRFRQHLRMLANALDGKGYDQVRVAAMELFPVVEQRTNWLVEVCSKEIALVPILLGIAAYREHWKGDLKEWEPNSLLGVRDELRELIRFLFGSGEVPEFLWKYWWRTRKLWSGGRRAFCEIAAGGSQMALRQVAPLLTRRAAHLAMTDGSGDEAEVVLRRAQVLAIGGDAELVVLVCNSPMVADFRRDVVYLPLLMMLSRAVGKVGTEACGLVIDYVYLQLTETVGSFQLEGRSLESLIRSARGFFGAMQEAAVFLGDPVVGEILDRGIRRRLIKSRGRAFRDAGIADYEVVSDKRYGELWHYSIRQIRTLGELTAEGQDMRHCVGSYASSCLRGRAVIFSLRSQRMGDQTMEREATIHLNPRTDRIVSVKAWRNRCPVAKTREVVERWAGAYGLQIRPGCF